jgi:1-acyl-sn-glycerol-3-phosphate acyltransferase
MKLNIRNILAVLYAFVTVIITVVLMIPAFILLLFGVKKTAYRYLNKLAKLYARHLLFMFGTRVHVSGLDNLPDSNNICFISNHQGIADIPIIAGYIPKTTGFIAKKELGRIPFLNIWMKAMNCVLIDRSSARSSIKTIERAVKQIGRGHAMVIFPEGTRSRNREMKNFKPGSFKLATGANTFAVPITIDGTYKIIEETGILTRTKVEMIIHPAIDISSLSEPEKHALHITVEEIIRKGLRPTPPASSR